MHQSVGLNFYNEKSIFPVFQNISNMEKHFQIRESLYRLLGVPSISFKDRDILEVAAGSGENSLYISAQLPKSFDICEPNSIAFNNIEKLYNYTREFPNGIRDNFPVLHTKPRLFKMSLEDFEIKKEYDFVICEGWIGGMTAYERSMLLKLSQFVKVGGILLISFYPPIGGLSSFLRRLLAFRIISKQETLEEQTKKLEHAFSSHLKTLPHLSRSNSHWVQDSILNPHIYVGPLSPRMIFETLSDHFSIYQSIPSMKQEWRWYKSLYGTHRNFNAHFLNDYDQYSHNLLDYRYFLPPRSGDKNRSLEELCISLINVSQKQDALGYAAHKEHLFPVLDSILKNLEDIIETDSGHGIKECVTLLQQEDLNADQISQMKRFNGCFGREQCYMSLVREH